MEDVTVVALSSLDAGALREIDGLVERVSRTTGHPALGEPKRLELAHLRGAAHGRPAEGSTAVLAHGASPSGLVGYGHVARGRRQGEFVVELVLADHEDEDAGGKVADALLEAAIAAVTGSASRGATLRWWIAKPTEFEDQLAIAHGFTLERELVQMRSPLPVPLAHGESVLATRPFRPGLDEAAWLVANNRAFADHPEQGQWDLPTLLEREDEPWFDPEGFRVLDVEGRMAGSCWTKIHRSTDPPLGEIYVIGVDPDFQGRGFGRGLTLAGLDWLSAQGLSTGMLYVDAANSAARALYRTIGFRDDHVDRAYVAHLGATGAPGTGTMEPRTAGQRAPRR